MPAHANHRASKRWSPCACATSTAPCRAGCAWPATRCCRLLPASLRRQLGASRRRLLLQAGRQRTAAARAGRRAAQPARRGCRWTTPTAASSCARASTKAPPTCRAGCCWASARRCAPCWPCPPSAEPRLREMMAHEIDRQTPFSLDQVSFEPRVLSRDAGYAGSCASNWWCCRKARLRCGARAARSARGRPGRHRRGRRRRRARSA